ncbi:MAG: molybdopterin molybdotransferase MoeA [Oscillospiraceae bacterium]|nr:molybdopterin molybdotransferase MoeA [Oscillospiraceae bacterium]
MLKVLDIDEVLKILSESRMAFSSFDVNILESEGMILAEDVVSGCNVPDFRRSAVDGFAVRHDDLNGASESMPVILKKIEDIHMGKESLKDVLEDQCSYVPTGGMVPYGADAVVMMEYTDVIQDDEVIFYSQISPLQNIISIGEDISIGEVLLCKGRLITAYDIGSLASCGITSVKVYKKVKLGIISTGDEIIPYDETPKGGQVRDVNSHLLVSLLKKNYAESFFYGIIKDSLESLKHSLETALSECEIVIISGGSSVGERDYTIEAISSIEDSEILCHGIAIKPGKPTIVAKAHDKIIFGLPGNPLAVVFVYKSLVEKFIKFNYEMEEENMDFTLAEFSINYHKAKGREEFIPVKLEYKEGKIFAEPIMAKSNCIYCMSQASGFVSINKNLEGLHRGEIVKVIRI